MKVLEGNIEKVLQKSVHNYSNTLLLNSRETSKNQCSKSHLNNTGQIRRGSDAGLGIGEKSMGNLTREINDLIQKQKENLKVDFEKAKENAVTHGLLPTGDTN